MAKLNNLLLVGAGGMGLNAVAAHRATYKPQKGYAEVKHLMIDTSYSNIAEADKDYFVRIESAKEGSGALRSENLDAIRDEIKDIMLSHVNDIDVAVLVSSASGGSGSTTSVLMARELALKGIPTALIMVFDTSSEIRAKNCIGSINTLQNFATKTGVPMVLYPIFNDTRRHADNEVQNAITNLALLFSNDHLELDNADTANFLNYVRVTNHPAALVALSIYSTKTTDISKENKVIEHRPISLAMVHTSLDAQEKLNNVFSTGYSCEGFIKEADLAEVNESVVYLIDNKEIDDLIKHLDTITGEYKEQAAAAASKVTLATKNHTVSVDDDGFAI